MYTDTIQDEFSVIKARCDTQVRKGDAALTNMQNSLNKAIEMESTMPENSSKRDDDWTWYGGRKIKTEDRVAEAKSNKDKAVVQYQLESDMTFTANAVKQLSNELLLSRIESEMRRWLKGVAKPLTWLGDAMENCRFEVKYVGKLKRVVGLGMKQTTTLCKTMKENVENGERFFDEGAGWSFDTLEDFMYVWEYMIIEFHKLFQGMEHCMTQRYKAWPAKLVNLKEKDDEGSGKGSGKEKKVAHWMEESSLRHSMEALNDCVSLIRDHFEKDRLILSQITSKLDQLRVALQWKKHELVEKKEKVLLLYRQSGTEETRADEKAEAVKCLDIAREFCKTIGELLEEPIEELVRRRAEEYNRMIEIETTKFKNALKNIDLDRDVYAFIRSHSRNLGVF